MPKRRAQTKDPDALTPLEEAFCSEWPIDKNGTAALRRAGSRGTNASLGSSAARMLAKDSVWKRCCELMDKSASRNVLTAQQVLEGLTRLATFDLSGLYDTQGNLKPINEWPEGYSKLVGGIETKVEFDAEQAQIARVTRLKTTPREKAFELLARHHKLLTDRIEITDTTGFSERLRKARERRLKDSK